MKQTKKKISPSRIAAAVTAVGLTVCAGICILLYGLTSYLPLLLCGVLQLLPALVNLLLLLAAREEKQPTVAAQEPVPEEEASEEDAPPPKRRSIKVLLRQLGHRMRQACRRFWQRERGKFLVGAILLVTVGANVAFWLLWRTKPIVFGLGYHVPVILVALFVLYIVLDKWCKHAGDLDRSHVAEERTEREESDPKTADHLYDQAVLHGLRGALGVGRWAQLLLALVLMIRLLGFVDLTKIGSILLALLFVYETAFLLISLLVRVIRGEMHTAPELSIPMPGLGGEDLGVIAYLEKNTGMTMRSLWSIRLIKQIIPYTAMVLVLLLWGFSGVVKIEAYQEGAHYRLGRLREETLQPGLHLTLPWPFDRVEVYDTESVSNMTIGYISDMSTDNIWTSAHGSEEHLLLLGGGNEVVAINLRVAYRIGDLRAYLMSSASPDALLQAAAYEIVTARTISTDLATLLATDRVAFSNSFKEELMERVKAQQTGLEVVDVVLESIHPPVDIADVYQQLISAGIEAERLVLVANGDAKVILLDAETERYALISKAEAEGLQSIANAEGAVAEFMAAVEADGAYYCPKDGCWNRLEALEKENESDPAKLRCPTCKTEYNEADLTSNSVEYRYYKYLQAIINTYADGKVVIVGDGVNAGNIYIGNVAIAK